MDSTLPHSILFTRFFMLSASHVQCTRIDSSLIFTCDVQKGLVFLKTQNELVIQIL